MHITHIYAKQFKCFESIDIELPKLTILTGANSSGKSSFLSALLAPFQSDGFPFYLSPNGKYVNMGDFVEMVHCNQKDKTVELDFAIQTDFQEEIEYKTSWILDPHSSLPQLKDLRAQGSLCNFSVKRLRGDSGYVLNVSENRDACASMPPDQREEFIKSTSSFFKALGDLLPKGKGPKKAPKTFADDLLEVKEIRNRRFATLEKIRPKLSSSIYVSQLANLIASSDSSLNFVSSFRLEPERTYYQRAKTERKIGRSGENYIDQIVEWERRGLPEFSSLQDELKKMGLLSSLRTRHMRGGRFELSVKSDRGGIWASLVDVGFGISQFLPIVVADLQLQKGSTLVIAQPEIHLHPKIQAVFANYLVERMRKQDRNYIVETHSEYLLNRIRLLIVKRVIEPSEVGIYYFQRSGCKTDVHRIRFTESGKIEGAPQDFFDTYMMDVMDIAMEAK